MPECSCALACQNQRSIWFWLEFSFVTFLCFKTKKSKEKTNNYNSIQVLCSFFCLCKRKNERKAHRQRYTAVAGRPDLTSVLLLTEQNNSYHRHNPGPGDEKSCFVMHCKPERRCVPFLLSLNSKDLFSRNGTRRLAIKNISGILRSLKNVLAPSFSSSIIN